MKLIYFAYGSNMSLRRLRARVPSAQLLGSAVLSDHRLAFHKVSHVDGSGKCDIVIAPGDSVQGGVFEIESAEKAFLDEVEGVGFGYELKHVDVCLQSRHHDVKPSRLSAFTYYATHIDPAIKPYSWYVQHVLCGAEELGLEERYIARLKQKPYKIDSNSDRERRERAIYQ